MSVAELLWKRSSLKMLYLFSMRGEQQIVFVFLRMAHVAVGQDDIFAIDEVAVLLVGQAVAFGVYQIMAFVFDEVPLFVLDVFVDVVAYLKLVTDIQAVVVTFVGDVIHCHKVATVGSDDAAAHVERDGTGIHAEIQGRLGNLYFCRGPKSTALGRCFQTDEVAGTEGRVEIVFLVAEVSCRYSGGRRKFLRIGFLGCCGKVSVDVERQGSVIVQFAQIVAGTQVEGHLVLLAVSRLEQSVHDEAGLLHFGVVGYLVFARRQSEENCHIYNKV